MPIPLPTSVTVEVEEGSVRVKGPRGELARRVPREISIVRNDGELRIERSSDEPTHRSLHGLTRSLIANMVTGVTDGYTRRLEVNGVGYRAAVSSGSLVLQVGYSHPVLYPAPAGISTITVTGTGFSANQALKVGVANVFGFQSVTTDSTGAFSVAITNDFGSSTWYTVEAGYQNNKGVFVALATTTFTVCSTNPC